MKRFLEYVEIRTKITSLFPFMMTLALLFYQRQPIRWMLTMLFFTSMLLFDMTTTAINNYIDTRTNGMDLPYKRTTARAILWVMLTASILSGLYLAYRTDIVVLLSGGLCFVCGILYTYGPVPISRQPLGEILSGIFYGIFIPFLILYINWPVGSLMMLTVSGQALDLSINIGQMARLLLFASIPACTTANIMLANNICDLNKDVTVNRYTLPYYLGTKALYLFAGLYYLCYAAIIAMVASRMLPPICLGSLLTIMVVQKNINAFLKKQVKGTTFGISIHNYIIINGAVMVMIFLSGLLV